MQCIGVDVGRSHVKVIAQGVEPIKFASVVGEWRPRKIASGGKYDVLINNKPYFIADLAVDESRAHVENTEYSKIHEETKVLFLTALGLVATPYERLTIVTGLPIDDHTPEIKEAFETLLKGTYDVTVNNRTTHFVVDQVLVAPEGAATYRDFTLNDDGVLVNPVDVKTRIVDLGSRVMNFATISATGKYIDRDSGSLDYGILDMHNADTVTNELREQFLKRIAGDLSRKWMDYSNRDLLLFTGGGSLALAPWIMQKFPNALILKDPVFTNARGYYKMGVSLWKRRQSAR